MWLTPTESLPNHFRRDREHLVLQAADGEENGSLCYGVSTDLTASEGDIMTLFEVTSGHCLSAFTETINIVRPHQLIAPQNLCGKCTYMSHAHSILHEPKNTQVETLADNERHLKHWTHNEKPTNGSIRFVSKVLSPAVPELRHA